MATKPKFKADASFRFGANRPARKPKAKGKGKKAGRSFGS